jgi:general secretion pathway protein G
MVKRKRRERTIFFPWERRVGLFRGPWTRSKPLLTALATIALLLLLGMRERDKTGVRSTRATLLVVRDALDAYRADHGGSCPDSLASLREEGYLVIDPKDAWGRPFAFSCPGRRHPDGYDLVSYGASGDQRGLDRIE